MIKSSLEPAFRAGSEGGGYFKIFLGGRGFREFSILGGFGIPPPFSHPLIKGIFYTNNSAIICLWFRLNSDLQLFPTTLIFHEFNVRIIVCPEYYETNYEIRYHAIELLLIISY